MNFLDLINAVLVRLREDQVDANTYLATPFYRLIASTVNDAKRTIEDSWQWSQLRGTDDIPFVVGQSIYELADTADTKYLINSIQNVEKPNYLTYTTTPYMRSLYANEFNEPVQNGTPGYWSWTDDHPTTRNQQIQIAQPSDSTNTMRIRRWKQQDALVNWDDVLLIPSLPVYSLATAMAARERGEVQGQQVGELFSLSDRYLSDAIAYDTSKHPAEMDWWAQDRLTETNVRLY